MVKEHRKQTERMIGMTRKFLEEMGLEKEQIDKILDENSQDIGKAKGDLEKVQNDLNTANTEIGTLKNTLKERDGQLETLKNSKDDVEGLKQQIQTLQNENKAKDDTHAAEIRQLKVDSAVNAALMAAHAKNTKAVVALLELENAELLDDGTIKGLDEQIKKLQTAEDSKFLFDDGANKKQFKGAKPGESGNDDGEGKVDTSKMTYTELAAYLAEHPDAKID